MRVGIEAIQCVDINVIKQMYNDKIAQTSQIVINRPDMSGISERVSLQTALTARRLPTPWVGDSNSRERLSIPFCGSTLHNLENISK